MPALEDPPVTDHWPERWRWAERFIKGVARFLARTLGRLNSVQIQSLSLSLQHELEDSCEEGTEEA